jgi:hypothetical protein
MPQTQTTCPRCRQPIMANIEQLFNVGADPEAKQRFLSGQFNVAQCQSCGYQGMIPVPLVYHDNEKEYLLTYFPPELGVPVTEQERSVGPLIKRVMDQLPAEQRKAYLFNPQTMLTLQGMIEKVLEGEGVTKEMLDMQQKQLNLLQRLVSASEEARIDIIKQEESMIDEAFFMLMSRMAEAAMAQGDQQTAQALAPLQQDLLANTEIGKKLQEQALDTQEAMKALKEASEDGGLTREKLLDLVIAAPNETRLTAMVGMVHGGLDYSFFQLLSEKIEQNSGDEQLRLSELRDKLLVMTEEIEKARQEQAVEAGKMLDQILAAENVKEATLKYLSAFDEIFISVLQAALQQAQQDKDTERSAKLQEIAMVIQEASRPPELAFVEELLSIEDDELRVQMLEKSADKITPELLQMMNGLASQSEEQGQPAEITERFKDLYRTAMGISMKTKLN